MLADFRPALRNLIRAPRFTIPAVLTLALGLGGALTFFSAFHGVFLRMPPFPGWTGSIACENPAVALREE